MVSTGVGLLFEFLKWFQFIENISRSWYLPPKILVFKKITCPVPVLSYFDFESSLHNQLSHKMDSYMWLFFRLKNPVMGWKTPQRRCIPKKCYSKRLNISKWVLRPKLKNYLILHNIIVHSFFPKIILLNKFTGRLPVVLTEKLSELLHWIKWSIPWMLSLSFDPLHHIVDPLKQ